MPDNLKIFGQTYNNATGIKVTDTNNTVLTYIRPQGTLSVTTNGTKDVTRYASIDVNVGGSAPTYQTKTVSPTESQQTVTPDSNYDALSSVTVNAISSTYVGSGITQRDETDLTLSGRVFTVPAGYYAEQETKSMESGSITAPTITIDTATGTINASTTCNQSGFVVSGTTRSSELAMTTQAATTITPTESEQVAVDTNVYTLGQVKVGAISSTYIGSGIEQRTETDLTTSGATVTVPAGYYAEQETKSVTSGSATGPSSLSGTSATVSTGTNTLTLTKTGVTTTPTVSAGYISGATASTATVTLTASVTTKAATTITPGTSDQTIASGTYLTGTQTIAGDADLVAGNIKSGVQIFGVTGSLSFITYYTGTGDPSSSLGNDGDIYLKRSS